MELLVFYGTERYRADTKLFRKMSLLHSVSQNTNEHAIVSLDCLKQHTKTNKVDKVRYDQEQIAVTILRLKRKIISHQVKNKLCLRSKQPNS